MNEIITVKNTEDFHDTTAEIVVQNNIDYIPKVSVIIPVYNTEKYLRECLDSVVNQTLKEIEIICVDDGSTDKSLDILKEYASQDNRITILKQENLHAGVARNAGLAVAKGEYISFIDSDDCYNNIALKSMYLAFQNQNPDFVYCTWQNISGSENREHLSMTHHIDDGLFVLNSTSKLSINVEIWNKLFKKEIINKYSIRFPQYRYGEDTSFTTQYIIVSNRAYGIDKLLYNYRLSENSLMDRLFDKGLQNYDSLYSFGYTYRFLQNLDQIYIKNNISFYLERLLNTAKFLFLFCNYNNYANFFKVLNERILNKINCKFLNDSELNIIKSNNYQRSVELLSRGSISISNKIKYYYDIQKFKMGKLFFSIKKKINNYNHLNLSFILDSNYFECTYIAICSIIHSKKQDTFLDINIINTNLSDQKKQMLKQMSNIDVSINLVNVNSTKYENFNQVYHVTTTSLLKFDLPNILQNVDKTLYIDGDVLVNKDLVDLYNTDISDKYIAATREQRAERRNYNLLTNSNYYINSGVMLLNLNKMRKDNLSNIFYQAKKNQPSSWKCQDQDVINFVCKDKLHILPPVYNNMIGIILKEQYSINDINNFYDTDYKNLHDFLDRSFIIHYAGDLKPWQKNKLPQKICKKYNKISNHIIINLNNTHKSLIFQRIFSITNQQSQNNKWYKVIYILGIKFSFRNKRKERRVAVEQEKQFIKNSLTALTQQNNELKCQNVELQNKLTIQEELLQKQNGELKNGLKILNENFSKYDEILRIELKKFYNQIHISNNNQKLNFKTVAQVTELIRDKINILPSDIDLIVGIPRSGIIPAYLIALFLNKKVCTINEFMNNLEPLNGYTRPAEERKYVTDKLKVLIIDDSVFSGKSLEIAKQQILSNTNSDKYEFQYCTIFAREESKHLVDYYFEIVESPRMFQWNYLNHCNAKVSCFDMDGVLCVDPTNEQNDDGEKYIDFIKNAKPLYIPAFKINSIVTSRLEKYRSQTEQWLKEHNITYNDLYMLDNVTAEERKKTGCHANFKAKIFREKDDCIYFIESNREQAKKNAELTGKQTICVETDEYFNG